MRTVFYSWQSDLPSSTNRGFIEDCLEIAIEQLHSQEKIRVFEPDRDVQGESGSPDIAETIFEKIDRCAALVADVSFINRANSLSDDTEELECSPCECTRPTPNPNVMGEWGRATKSVGFERIIAVLNTATGRVEDLPFDMRKRSVITYRLVRGEEKREAKKMLVGKLKGALKEILALPLALLQLQFADAKTHLPMGPRFATSNTYFEIDHEALPDFGYRRKSTGVLAGLDDLANSNANRNFWRQKASYVLHSQLMRPVRFALTNTGGKLLSNIRLEIAVGSMAETGIIVMDASDIPDIPQRQHSLGMSSSVLKRIRSARFHPGELTVSKLGETQRIVVKYGNVQAKATVVSETIYLGGVSTALEGILYADELSEPISVPLTIEFTTEFAQMPFEQLKAFQMQDNAAG